MASIQGIYLAFFGRPADPLGLAYWEEQTNGGADLSVMLDALSGTAEYQDRFVGMNNEEVIQSIYQALFGRDAEPEGLAHFLEALANGTQTLGSIAVNILDGAQGSDLAMIENKIAAAELFTASLDTPEEIAAYSGNEAAEFGRQFLSTVTEDPETVPTAETVQEQINTDLPNYVPEEVAPPAPAPGGGGTGPAPTPDPEDVFLARWKALDKQYYDFAAREEAGPGLNIDINNSFINLANDYVAYLNTGKAAIVDVVQHKVLVGGVYVDDNNRAQTFHDNVLGNINSGVLSNSRPKNGNLVSEAAKKFAERPLADGKTDSSLDENAAWSWDFANGIPSGKLPSDDTVIVASGANTDGLGDISSTVLSSINGAVAAAGTGDTIHVRPGTYGEQVVLTGDEILMFKGVSGAKIDGSGFTHGINATGATFGGTVTIDGFTVVAGTQGGIGQFMSASNGTLIVTNNVIAVSDDSYSAHGNGIQISGKDSEVAYNTIDATPYSGLNNSWSTSGITVVKSASGSTVHDNVIQLSENKALGVGQSAIGIGVDGYYGAMENINISANIISSLSSGISLSEEIEVKVEGNTLIGNKQGISLGYQDNHTSGDRWFDDFYITISNNIFENSKLADIAFFDFDAGSVHIGENNYSGTVPALWFDEAGTYGDAENLALLSIDITTFITVSELSDNVFVSSADGFSDIQLTERVDATDDWVVTGAGDSGFKYLQITLVGSGSFNDVEVLGLFGITPDLV